MKILDVGGWKNTYKDATHIIDIMPKPENCSQEYIQMDVCSGKWPFKDKEFDYVYCSNLLEDIKDPAFVCKEIIRVGKFGKIVVPSNYYECRRGVDAWPGNNTYTGFYHHRWICFYDFDNEELILVPKTPITHVFDWTKKMNEEDIEKNMYIIVDWNDSFSYKEIVLTDWLDLYDIFKKFFKLDPLNELGYKR